MTADCQLCGSERDDCHEVKADGIGDHMAWGTVYYLCPFCYTSSPSGMAEGYLSNPDHWKIAGRIINYLENSRFQPRETRQGKENEALRLENENLRIKLAELTDDLLAHNNDFTQPPELTDLRYRRPDGNYWESKASNKETALPNFWERWHRETKLPYPRTPPYAPEPKRHSIINRVGADHRVERQKDKSE